MNKPIALVGLLALALLAACSKPASTGAQNKATPVAAAEPAAKPATGRAEYLTKVLSTIDTTPQCQPFRDQLEQAGPALSEELKPDEMNQINDIVGQAYAAGCLRRQ